MLAVLAWLFSFSAIIANICLAKCSLANVAFGSNARFPKISLAAVVSTLLIEREGLVDEQYALGFAIRICNQPLFNRTQLSDGSSHCSASSFHAGAKFGKRSTNALTIFAFCPGSSIHSSDMYAAYVPSGKSPALRGQACGAPLKQ